MGKQPVRKTLGRGIGALLPEDTKKQTMGNEVFTKIVDTKKKEIIDIPLDKISPNPFQPRMHFDQEKIEELSESIKSYGVLEPILVTKADGDTYNIVAGERRYKASSLSEQKTIPCIILSLSDEERLEIAIIENLQREELNPIEMALSFRDVMNLSKITQEELAKKLSVSRPVVSNLIRLLSLPEHIQDAIKEKKINQSHARLLLSIEDDKKRDDMFNQILNNKLSVKSLENKIKNNTDKKSNNKDKSMSSYEQELIEFFGTKVSINGNINKGNITINYFNQKDFSRILDMLNISFD